MDALKARFVRNVKSLIEKRGLTVKGLASQGHITYGVLRRALDCRDSGMSTGTICKVSEALGVDPGVLTAPE